MLARLDIATLKADLDIAQAEEKLQTIRTERLEKLATSNRSTEDELDKAKTDLEIKQAQVRKIEAMIENRTLRSPVRGVVTEIKRDISESVSAATPHVITVVQIDKLIVNLFLASGARQRADCRRRNLIETARNAGAGKGKSRFCQPGNRSRQRHRARQIRDRQS